MAWLGGCEELCAFLGIPKPECCVSCHDDADEGYGQLLEYYVGPSILTAENWFSYCCAIPTGGCLHKEDKT